MAGETVGVSVVLTTYNRPEWLTQTVMSVLGQVAVDLELVVVDNGSEDSTMECLSQFDDPRVRVIRHQTNIGMIAGQNSGLAAAEGEWLAMIDDDDIWAPSKLTRQLAVLEASGAQWGACGCVFVDPDLEILGANPPPNGHALHQELARRYIIPGGTSTLIWRRGLLESDSFDPEVPHLSDWELCLRLRRWGPPAVATEPLVAYRQHGTAMSMRTHQFLDELDRLAEIHPDVDPRVTRPYMHQFLGSQQQRSGNRRAAASHYWTALRGGNLGALPRLASLMLPHRAQQHLRRRWHSDRAYLEQAAGWLGEFQLVTPTASKS